MTKLQLMSDKAAVGLSLLCVIHCLFLPIILILMPALTGLLAFNDELFHRMLLVAVVPISAIALVIGYLHHRSHRVLLIGLVGLTILIVTSALGHAIVGKHGEIALTVLGTSIIAYGHFLNYRLRRHDVNIEIHDQD